MSFIFAGSPLFAVQHLQALMAADLRPRAVLTQPDRACGRGLKIQPSAVKRYALQQHLTILQPPSIDQSVITQIRSLTPLVMVVVAYGQLLPQALLDLPRYGCFNVHASLLPRWRGAAPIPRAILAGDQDSGVTLMRMRAQLDAGEILAWKKTPIAIEDTAATLHDQLAKLGAELLVEHLPALIAGKSPVVQKQDSNRVTYATKIDKQEARIDWSDSAVNIARRVRAFNPAPMCYGVLHHQRVRILMARAAATTKFLHLPKPPSIHPGFVYSAQDQILVACGEGALQLLSIQFAGKKPQPAQIMHAQLLGHTFA